MNLQPQLTPKSDDYMPRFYFNIYDGLNIPDDTGTELQDLQEARIQAIKLAGSVIKDDARRIAKGDDWHLEVTDEHKDILLRYNFRSLEAPTLSSRSGKDASFR